MGYILKLIVSNRSEIAPPGYPQFLIFNKGAIPANSGFGGINFLIKDFLFSVVGVLGLIAGGCICISGGSQTARQAYAVRHPFSQCGNLMLPRRCLHELKEPQK